MTYAKWRLGMLLTAAASAFTLALASPALASNTVTLTVGPVALPNVPVSACLDTLCVTTPALSSLTLTASVTSSGSVPTVSLTRGSCPAGQQGAVITVTESVTEMLTVDASVTATGPNGPITIPLGPLPIILPANHSITVSACTT